MTLPVVRLEVCLLTEAAYALVELLNDIAGKLGASKTNRDAGSTNDRACACEDGQDRRRSFGKPPRVLYGVDDSGQAVLKRKLRRSEVLPFFAGVGPGLVGIEACQTAHYWGRENRRAWARGSPRASALRDTTLLSRPACRSFSAAFRRLASTERVL
jgi:hypothetical protein